MDRESFIGLWDMYCGWVHSELLLQTDGTYHHSLWGGMQSHWGVWSLVDQNGQAFLVLELRGAQPAAYPGLLGLVSMIWPSTETWAVTAVQSNQIDFYHGRMVRRAFAGLPAGAGMGMPFFSPVPPSTPPPSPVPPQTPAPLNTPGLATPNPPVVSPSQQAPPVILPPAAYSAPAPPDPPDAHQSPVMAQWLESVKAAQAFHVQMLQSSMETSQSLNKMVADQFAANFTARQTQIHKTEQNMHAQAQDFITGFIQG